MRRFRAHAHAFFSFIMKFGGPQDPCTPPPPPLDPPLKKWPETKGRKWQLTFSGMEWDSAVIIKGFVSPAFLNYLYGIYMEAYNRHPVYPCLYTGLSSDKGVPTVHNRRRHFRKLKRIMYREMLFKLIPTTTLHVSQWLNAKFL